MNRLYLSATLFVIFMAVGCSKVRKKTAHKTQWKFSREIPLKGIAPVGIAIADNSLWLSDVARNRIVKIDLEGDIIREFRGLKRPMHIAINDGKIYIPEYASDTIRVLKNGRIATHPLPLQVDAPGGVAVEGSVLAVADFYNHRIILQQGGKTITIGRKGHYDGELNYPTDLDIYDNLIYVADAYNNRVQVFDLNGKYVKMIGWKEGIKVATGLKVTDDQVIVADFHGDRILIYDHEGKLLQILSQNLNQPTDIDVSGKTMYVTNYAGNSISVFE